MLNFIELLYSHGVSLPGQFPTEASTHVTSPERLLGFTLILVGTGIRIACYRRMAKNFTFELAVREDHKLITSGPYAFVRHPAYGSGCAVLLGSILFNLGRGSWWAECAVVDSWMWLGVGVAQVVYAALFAHGAYRRCLVEDEALKEHFKSQWVSWAKNTPYRMFPLLF